MKTHLRSLTRETPSTRDVVKLVKKVGNERREVEDDKRVDAKNNLSKY